MRPRASITRSRSTTLPAIVVPLHRTRLGGADRDDPRHAGSLPANCTSRCPRPSIDPPQPGTGRDRRAPRQHDPQQIAVDLTRRRHDHSAPAPRDLAGPVAVGRPHGVESCRGGDRHATVALLQDRGDGAVRVVEPVGVVDHDEHASGVAGLSRGQFVRPAPAHPRHLDDGTVAVQRTPRRRHLAEHRRRSRAAGTADEDVIAVRHLEHRRFQVVGPQAEHEPADGTTGRRRPMFARRQLGRIDPGREDLDRTRPDAWRPARQLRQTVSAEGDLRRRAPTT